MNRVTVKADLTAPSLMKIQMALRSQIVTEQLVGYQRPKEDAIRKTAVLVGSHLVNNSTKQTINQPR